MLLSVVSQHVRPHQVKSVIRYAFRRLAQERSSPPLQQIQHKSSSGATSLVPEQMQQRDPGAQQFVHHSSLGSQQMQPNKLGAKQGQALHISGVQQSPEHCIPGVQLEPPKWQGNQGAQLNAPKVSEHQSDQGAQFSTSGVQSVPGARSYASEAQQLSIPVPNKAQHQQIREEQQVCLGPGVEKHNASSPERIMTPSAIDFGSELLEHELHLAPPAMGKSSNSYFPKQRSAQKIGDREEIQVPCI